MSAPKKKVRVKYAKSGPLLLIAAPGIVYLLINNYIPMLGIFLAFKRFSYKKGIFGSAWSGLDNFRFLFQSKDAVLMTRNTLLYNLAFIVLGTIFAIAIAIMLNALGDSIRTKFFQSALLLPNLMSWVVIAYMVYAFLNADSGFVNNTIIRLLGGREIAWYMEKGYWPFILVFVFLWKNAGYQSIIYLASIAGIDKSIYEAASLDGASRWQQIGRITLPLLKPTVIILTLMAVGRIFFSDFGLFYQVPMNSGALYETTQTIDTYVYRGLMELNDVGMSAAAGLFQSVLGFIVVVTANALVRRFDGENVLF
ncbi:ABC transporter permease [Lachnoclostridium sp. Marseille-P6806]|uniref:ABC transporter permease n=1 Tax=Lachnoclostridium sp. Marseille-P6806 TaxID=2364793 RepID=UPI00103247B9|nr:ABC transporter permease subunit [Lachnoclostridium sp. Marseille-P6806]